MNGAKAQLVLSYRLIVREHKIRLTYASGIKLGGALTMTAPLECFNVVPIHLKDVPDARGHQVPVMLSLPIH